MAHGEHAGQANWLDGRRGLGDDARHPAEEWAPEHADAAVGRLYQRFAAVVTGAWPAHPRYGRDPGTPRPECTFRGRVRTGRDNGEAGKIRRPGQHRPRRSKQRPYPVVKPQLSVTSPLGG